MKINKSTAKSSSIIDIGVQLNKKARDNSLEVLSTQRGVNAVTNIDLSNIIPLIDFNSPEIQNYPAVSGNYQLLKVINKKYFQSQALEENLFITIGSVFSLNLSFSILDVETVYLPEFYWGAYVNILKIANKKYKTYKDFNFLLDNIDLLDNCAVVICEPNNPLGSSETDDHIFKLISELDKNHIPVLMDSPYRRVFYDSPDFYIQLLSFKNVIIFESFSKFIGLSGQRIGFVHSSNAAFNAEFKVRLLYATNGVNGFAQKLVQLLLSTEQGDLAISEFLRITRKGIYQNIKYLRNNGLLAEEFYEGKEILGIFAVVKKSQEELFDKNIGGVNLSFFNSDKQKYNQYSRVCVSVPHQKFKKFFSQFFS